MEQGLAAAVRTFRTTAGRGNGMQRIQGKAEGRQGGFPRGFTRG